MKTEREFLKITELKALIKSNEWKTSVIKKVFRGLLKRQAPVIKEWVTNCGIQKNITFHCSRHTNATLLLENGTDLYAFLRF